MFMRMYSIVRPAVHLSALHPKTTVVLAVAFAVCAMFGAIRLRPTASLHEMFGSDDPTTAALRVIVEEFNSVDNLLVIATTKSTDSKTILRGKLLTFAKSLDAAIRVDPDLSDRVTSIDYGGEPLGRRREFLKQVILPCGLLYLSDTQFTSFLKRLTPQHIRAQMAKNEALMAAPGVAADVSARTILQDPLRLYDFISEQFPFAEPLVVKSGPGLRLSHDGSSLLIRISGTRSVNELEFSRDLVRDIKALVDRINIDDLTVEYSGPYAIAARSERLIRKDMISSINLTVILIFILFMLVYRSVREFFLAMTVVAFGILIGFGIFSVFRGTINPATAVAGAVLCGLGVDYSIHLFAHARNSMLESGSSCKAINHSIDVIGISILTAGMTSLIGFYSVAQANEMVLRDFGLLCVLGLCGVLLASFTLLPALYVLWGKLLCLEPPNTRTGATGSGRSTLLDLADRNPGRCVACTAAVWSASIIVILSAEQWINVETDLTVMHPTPNRPLELQAEIAAKFGEPANTVILLLQADSDQALVEQAHSTRIALDDQRLKTVGLQGTFGIASLLPDPDRIDQRLSEIRRINTDAVVSDFLQSVNESIFDPAVFTDYAESLRTMLSVRSAPTLSDLRRYPNVIRGILPRAIDDQSLAPSSRCVMLVQFSDSLDQHERRAEAIETLESIVSGMPGVTVTGLSAMGHHAEKLIRRDLIRVMSFAVVCVVLLLLLVFHRPVTVLLILLPTAFAVCCLLASMHVLGERFNTLNIIGVPLLVGIGVDDGIFLVGIATRTRQQRKSHDVLTHELRTSCHAVLMTSATTILAFGSLIFTSTPAIRSLGRLSAIGIGSCLFATLFMLAPILLMRHRCVPESSPN